MSKKSGTVIKIVAFAAGVAAVGAACYVYRDKIKEFVEKNDVKGKVTNAKNYVTNKLQKNKENDDFDDAEFFDDPDNEDSSSRGYTSITITSDEDSVEEKADEAKSSAKDKVVEIKDALVEKAKEVKDRVVDKAEEIKETVADKAKKAKDTAADKAEEVKDAVADKAEEVKDAAADKVDDVKEAVEETVEEAPEEYEYEGLSDVSEDEDALAEEAALDGV